MAAVGKRSHNAIPSHFRSRRFHVFFFFLFFFILILCEHKQIILWKRNIVSKKYEYIVVGRAKSIYMYVFIRWALKRRNALGAQVNKEIVMRQDHYYCCSVVSTKSYASSSLPVAVAVVVCQFATMCALSACAFTIHFISRLRKPAFSLFFLFFLFFSIVLEKSILTTMTMECRRQV